MSRKLRFVTVTVDRPDERSVPEKDRVGPAAALVISSDDLKTRPVHTLRLTEDQALRLVDRLSSALVALRTQP